MEVTTYKKKVLMIVFGVLLLALFTLGAFLLYVNFQYNSAIEPYDAKNYSKAIAQFEVLGNYRESKNFIVLCNIGEVDQIFDIGNFKDAKRGYLTLEQTEEVKSKVFECDYRIGLAEMERSNLYAAKSIFNCILDYKDSAAIVLECDYLLAQQKMEAADFRAAKLIFDSLKNYKDSLVMASECAYQEGIQAVAEQNYYIAYSLLYPIRDYKDTEAQLEAIKYARYDSQNTINTPEEQLIYTQYDLEFIQAQTWYNGDTPYDLTLSDYMLGENFYQVKSTSRLSSDAYCAEVILNVLSESGESTQVLEVSQVFPFSGYEVYELYCYGDYSQDNNPPPLEANYCNVSWNEYLNISTEIEQRSQRYDNYTVASYAASAAQAWLEKTVYSRSAYSECSLRAYTVTYDWTTKTYTCNAEVSYSTNVYNALIGRSKSYSVNASYIDTGAELNLVLFSVY